MAYDYLIDKAKEDAERKSLADHIRAKGGTSAKLDWGAGFEAAVDAIPKGKPEQTKTVTIKANGTSSVVPDGGKTLSKVNITVQTPAPKPEQTKTVTITANGDTTITPDVGKVLSSVLAKVNVNGGGGGDVQTGPFVYMYGGTFTPASDMNLFNPPGYVHDGTYKKRTALAIGTKKLSRDGVHMDVGVDFTLTRISRSGTTFNGYGPQATEGGVRLDKLMLKAGTEYMYIVAQYVY